MAQYILSLDQGTTSSRALLIDQDCNVVATEQIEFPQYFPKAGWVEHDAIEIWDSQIRCAKEVIAKAGIAARQIAGIGITNQRETTVVWDRVSGEPIHNAIVWQDRRTANYCRSLKEAGHEPRVANKTGLVLDAYFSATKIRWILENVPDARDRAARGRLCFGTIDSWLVWNLTGGDTHVTDISNASRTLLLNIETGRWDDELVSLFEIEKSMLPAVRSNSELYGETALDLFGRAIPITGMAGDQQAALFGQMCIHPGMAKNTYGTGCFLLRNTGDTVVRSSNRLLSTVAWRLGDSITYALEGSVFIGGAVVQWLRDGLGLISSSSEIDALAASVDGSDGVMMVPAFTGMGAPYWDPNARGAILGITRGTTSAHIAYAALESIAYQSAEVLQAMNDDSKQPLNELRVDGGATRNDLLMQIQADLLGIKVARAATSEATALGAAFFAGLATGFWPSLGSLESRWASSRVFSPSISPDEASEKLSQWKRAVERSLNWIETRNK